MDLNAIRTQARTQLDLDSSDLPDSLLDAWAREASKKIERAEKRWPFYAKSWTFATVEGTANYAVSTIGSDVREITAMHTPRWTLDWLGTDDGQASYNGYQGVGEPVAWSQWGTTLSLYPTPDAAYTVTVRGYRTPTDWVAAGAGAAPDMDGDLHQTIATWVLSRTYAMQEDTELATYFAQAFDRELEAFRRRIVDTPAAQPLILGRGRPRRSLTAPRLPWE